MSQTNESQPTEQPPPSQDLAPSGKPRYRSKPFSPRTRVFLLIFGDIFCFVMFAWLGTVQHDTNPGFNLPYNLWVALPFMLGWFIVAPLMGAFKPDLANRPKKMLIRTALTWLAAWPVAMLMRWLLVADTRTLPLTSFLIFALVVFVVNLGMLIIWRWPFALNNQLRLRGL